MKTAYPATLGIRKQIRTLAGDIFVQPGDAHAGTVGTAFDMLSGFLIVENHVPLDPSPTRGWRPVHALITQQVIALAHDAQPDRASDDDFYKAVWVLAELGAIVRSGHSIPDGKLEQVIRAAPGFDELLDITPTDGIRQLRELEAVAAEQLYPYLHDPVTVSASFPAVREIVQAESDIVAGGLLLDYKTAAGAPHKTTGARAFFPSDADIFQILGYALMDDPDDGYGITAAGLYAARYGATLAWDLPGLLADAAGGRTVNVDAARSSLRSALEADYEAASTVLS